VLRVGVENGQANPRYRRTGRSPGGVVPFQARWALGPSDLAARGQASLQLTRQRGRCQAPKVVPGTHRYRGRSP
jgi:hypothetical protein